MALGGTPECLAVSPHSNPKLAAVGCGDKTIRTLPVEAMSNNPDGPGTASLDDSSIMHWKNIPEKVCCLNDMLGMLDVLHYW